MAGKFCNGGTFDATKLYNSKAYCEGRKAFVDGDLIGTDPFLTGSEQSVAWLEGFDAANPIGGNVAASVTCCAV